ncbi:hypothetical protein AVEN_213944-1 [Araneus ventricosus]|uniref:Uncharacterized protein n=1 Tax=Araneus ventricosus TaxID=182803 RepID=A0A4Y2W3F2_ARAVE|nr:hypothetical protein AVEN_213944-1 [Araneus ventricosus]
MPFLCSNTLHGPPAHVFSSSLVPFTFSNVHILTSLVFPNSSRIIVTFSIILWTAERMSYLYSNTLNGPPAHVYSSSLVPFPFSNVHILTSLAFPNSSRIIVTFSMVLWIAERMPFLCGHKIYYWDVFQE